MFHIGVKSKCVQSLLNFNTKKNTAIQLLIVLIYETKSIKKNKKRMTKEYSKHDFTKKKHISK